MKRRTFLTLAAGTAMGAIASPYVHAQSKKFAGITLRINGYGGVYDDALIKNVAKPLEDKYGLKVQFIAGQTVPDMLKLIANKDNPPYDMFMGDDPHMVELVKANVVEAITPAEVPNVKRILPGFRDFGDHGVPFSVASVIPVFNSKQIKKPLMSYSDVARADLKDRAVVPAPVSTGNTLMLLGIAEENGGSVSNMDPAFKVMSAAKPNIVALAQTNVAEVQMFQNDEVYAGIFWDGRAYELRTKGVPIVTVVPEKGICAVSSYTNVVKGMKYPEAAHAYCEQLLSDQGMLAIPNILRYGVTTDIKLPDDISKDILFNSPARVALKKKIDWAALMAQRSALIDRFNREIKA